MNFAEYQELARRTQNMSLTWERTLNHAVLGMAAELGEILSVQYDDIEKLKDEISDLYWFIAELADVFKISLQEIADEITDYWRYDSSTIATMVMNAAEIAGMAQKRYQGHVIDAVILRDKIKDMLRATRFYVEMHGMKVSDVLKHNIEKLRRRYPGGFEATRSLNREEGDV